MKSYRLGYDYVLLCYTPFEHEGQLLLGLSINVLFKVFDPKGEEVFFQSEELTEQEFNFGNGKSHSLNELIGYSFDAKNGLTSSPNISKIQHINNFTIQYEVKNYFKDVNGELPEELKPFIKEFGNFPCAEPEEISKEEFMAILEKNMSLFDIEDNLSLQSTAYFTEEVYESIECPWCDSIQKYYKRGEVSPVTHKCENCGIPFKVFLIIEKEV